MIVHIVHTYIDCTCNYTLTNSDCASTMVVYHTCTVHLSIKGYIF